ncbi:unnamed protein product [Hydatigera taeniaeformis]|uniref:F-box domain-containing protein n=1 Tax=Hydatigena taeniaeformis TaxID=6205 RepID=A0A0R3WQ13_HYDTA|nr:unnamed protein product [Hydatigera taeniaeformis]
MLMTTVGKGGTAPNYLTENHAVGRRIIDLPPELALKICKYLDAADLVRVCNSIPHWKWMLSTPRCFTLMLDYINQWTWLNEGLCQLLFSRSPQISFQEAYEAIRYQTEESDSFRRFLSTLSHGSVHRTIRIRRLPFLDIDKLSYCECMLQLELPNPDIASYIPTNKYNLTVLCNTTTNFTVTKGSIEVSGGCVTRTNGCTGEEDEPDSWDCVIYLVHPLRFLVNDLIATIDALSPHQTLIVAVIVNTGNEKTSEMDCLTKFIHSLGGYHNSPLCTVPTKWRLWCIKRQNNDFINWSDLLEWSCYDVMSKQK